MAFGNIEIEYKTRICKVGDRAGYFHCWEHYADVLAPGLTIGSHPGGQFSRAYGIVEFQDGVERVDPSRIKFIDEDNASLKQLNEVFFTEGQR